MKSTHSLFRILLCGCILLCSIQTDAQQRIGDNLGNHKATRDLQMQNHQILEIGGMGIGLTPDPANKLEVAGKIKVTNFQMTDGAAAGRLFQGDANGNGTWVTLVPAGVIMMWSGSSIPAGWALCDGTNGTPDLKGKFILGAAGIADIGSTGGSNTHTLTVAELPPHTHTGTAGSATPSMAFTGTSNQSTGNTRPSFSGNSATTSSDGGGVAKNILVDYGAPLETSGTFHLPAGNREAVVDNVTPVISPSATKTLDMYSHTHTVTASGTVGNHNHTYTATGTISGGSHTHTFTTAATGSGAAIDMVPVYYTLAYIMKL